MAKLTNTQADALREIKSGDYVYNPYTGSARHVHHRPGNYTIAARTFGALFRKGLVEVDRRRYPNARITEAGRQALAEYKEH